MLVYSNANAAYECKLNTPVNQNLANRQLLSQNQNKRMQPCCASSSRSFSHIHSPIRCTHSCELSSRTQHGKHSWRVSLPEAFTAVRWSFSWAGCKAAGIVLSARECPYLLSEVAAPFMLCTTPASPITSTNSSSSSIEPCEP